MRAGERKQYVKKKPRIMHIHTFSLRRHYILNLKCHIEMCKYILTQGKSQAIRFLLLQVLKAAESIEHCCHVAMCYLPTVSSRTCLLRIYLQFIWQGHRRKLWIELESSLAIDLQWFKFFCPSSPSWWVWIHSVSIQHTENEYKLSIPSIFFMGSR